MSFPEYFFAQDFDRVLGLLSLVAIAYLALLAGAALALRRHVEPAALRAGLVWTAAVLLATVVGISLFEAAALWSRSSHERPAGSYEDFVAAARAAFFGLYAGLALLAAGGGLVIARRHTRHPVVVAIGCGAAIVGYLIVTFPFVEFMNECHVGRSFILDDVRC
jgi:hypothetical protein